MPCVLLLCCLSTAGLGGGGLEEMGQRGLASPTPCGPESPRRPFPWGRGSQQGRLKPPSRGPTDALCSCLQVKLWRLPAPGQALPSGPGLVLGPEDVPVEVLQFHPSADGVLLSAAGKALKVWDAARQQPLTGTAALVLPGQPGWTAFG